MNLGIEPSQWAEMLAINSIAAMKARCALLTATLVIIGMRLFPAVKEESSESATFTLFKTEEKPQDVRHLELKKTFVTLKGRDNREHSLLLGLAYAVFSDAARQKAENGLPKFKGALVSMFSGMEYGAPRAMSVDDIHLPLMTVSKGRSVRTSPLLTSSFQRWIFNKEG